MYKKNTYIYVQYKFPFKCINIKKKKIIFVVYINISSEKKIEINKK